jgi:hypothetical protein
MPKHPLSAFHPSSTSPREKPSRERWYFPVYDVTESLSSLGGRWFSSGEETQYGPYGSKLEAMKGLLRLFEESSEASGGFKVDEDVLKGSSFRDVQEELWRAQDWAYESLEHTGYAPIAPRLLSDNWFFRLFPGERFPVGKLHFSNPADGDRQVRGNPKVPLSYYHPAVGGGFGLPPFDKSYNTQKKEFEIQRQAYAPGGDGIRIFHPATARWLFLWDESDEEYARLYPQRYVGHLRFWSPFPSRITRTLSAHNIKRAEESFKKRYPQFIKPDGSLDQDFFDYFGDDDLPF